MLFECECEEWAEYRKGGHREKFKRAFESSFCYWAFKVGKLCGHERCRDEDGYGVYAYDLLVDKARRAKEYGRLLMEQPCRDYPQSAVYVLGNVYPYYGGERGYEIEGRIYIVKVK